MHKATKSAIDYLKLVGLDKELVNRFPHQLRWAETETGIALSLIPEPDL